MVAVVETEVKSSDAFPSMIALGNLSAPAAPVDLESTGVERTVLCDLRSETAQAVLARAPPSGSPDRCACLFRLSRSCWSKWRGTISWMSSVRKGPSNRRYTTSGRGLERASRLLNTSSYIGPAPVPLETYSAVIHTQHSQFPEVSLEEVRQALGELILPDDDLMTAALPFCLGSAFLFGRLGTVRPLLPASCTMSWNAIYGFRTRFAWAAR